MKRTLVVLAVCVAGCAPRLPTHEWRGSAHALQVMADRAGSVGDISAACEVTLADAEGEGVTLEGALAARGDTHLRLRAWKFNQPVLDVTVNDEGLFVWMREKNGKESRELRLGPIAEAWSLMTGAIFAREPVGAKESGHLLEARYPLAEGDVVAWIDRSTLTVRRYEVIDGEGRVRQTLTLDRYELVGGTPWPMRLTAEGEQGRVVVRLRDVELRADLPEGAFMPPPGAERRP